VNFDPDWFHFKENCQYLFRQILRLTFLKPNFKKVNFTFRSRYNLPHQPNLSKLNVLTKYPSPAGVNFTNILRAAFTLVDHKTKSKKIQLSHQYLFTLSGSRGTKAACRTMMKLTPGLWRVIQLTDKFLESYRVCHRFILTKRVAYIGVDFDHF